ncbi:MAG: hypothetical protein EBV07_01310 [Proteobacteria bacterium]|nr:hypothetical protein [Pseudomonadota bacterium]
MDIEIETLLFKIVDKPKHHLMTKVINLWENRYRVNVYIEIQEDNFTKRKIHSSYFCHYNPGKLTIIPEKEVKNESRTTKSTV